jgi:predicted secreted protein with PEFG-CTERM motif
MFFVNVKIYFILILFSFSILPVFAQSDEIPFLTVKTDDDHYDEGDTVVISGQVATVIVDTPIILQVWFEGNMIEIAQFSPAQDGSYSQTIIAEKPSWKNEGEYLVRISYAEGNIAESTINFTPNQEFLETIDSFEVEIPNGGTFDIEYTIKGGVVKDIILEPDNFTLLVLIEAPDEGTVSLKLPRESIDAEKPNGQDEFFIILIDNIQFPYEETETNDQSRLITINFEEKKATETMSTYEIEIIGTKVIPEFGTMTVLILLLGVIITVGFTKNKFQLKI